MRHSGEDNHFQQMIANNNSVPEELLQRSQFGDAAKDNVVVKKPENGGE
jgi:hypothetical protein